MKLRFFILLMAVTGLLSCEKSVENFSGNPPSGSDTVWSVSNTTSLLINELHQALQIPAMADTFNLANGGIVQFPGNTYVTIPPAAFAAGGVAVDGKGTIELSLLKKKGDLIRFRRPTTSNGYLLQTGGVIYINFSKNGQALQLRANKYLQISFTDSAPTLQMLGFYGVPAGTGSFENFNWIPVTDSSLRVFPTPSGYQVISNRLQWINCDFFIDTSVQKSRTVLSMPRDFTNANTSTFIVFKNIRSVMQFTADATNRIWKTERVPVGRDVQYVTITKKGTDYWIGIQDATTAPFQNVHIIPQKTTLQGLNAFLDNL